MAKPTREFHAPGAEWRAAGMGVEGIWAQTLAQDPETGDYTGLLRYDAGVDTSPTGTRVHEYWEEVLILEGEFTDISHGSTFSAGMYACRPPGMPHGPWRTARGVLMLEVRYQNRPAGAPILHTST